MSARFVATIGNGRLLAKIGADGSLLSLCAPHLDSELLQRPVHATIFARSLPLPTVATNRALIPSVLVLRAA